MRVYKYRVPIVDEFVLSLPKDAKILSVQEQREASAIWVLVDDDADTLPFEDRHFRLAGTGHPIDIPGNVLHYVGTWQSLGGTLVWHLFEVAYDHS